MVLFKYLAQSLSQKSSQFAQAYCISRAPFHKTFADECLLSSSTGVLLALRFSEMWPNSLVCLSFRRDFLLRESIKDEFMDNREDDRNFSSFLGFIMYVLRTRIHTHASRFPRCAPKLSASSHFNHRILGRAPAGGRPTISQSALHYWLRYQKRREQAVITKRGICG